MHNSHAQAALVAVLEMSQSDGVIHDGIGMQVWAGQAAALAKPIPARDFVLQMWEKTQELL